MTPQGRLPREHNSDRFQELVDLHSADDDTLDAFDKELLAERPDHRPQQALNSISRTSLALVATSRQAALGMPNVSNRYNTPSLNFSSSSPTALISSPTFRVVKAKKEPTLLSSERQQRFSGDAPSIEPPEMFESAPPRPVALGDPSKKLDLKHAPPIVQGIQLISAHDLPDRFRAIFPFPIFNAVQSKCFAPSFWGDDNLVLSAPTGSGKTVVMELAICRLLHTFQNGQFKVVYQAPTKSLCAERHRDWEKRFATLDLRCAELTGDTDHTQLKSVQSASIIITTPEKWDSVTRKWKDHIRLMQLVKLFLIDEVHILRESRGATLEAVVSRMKSVGSNVRFVALSATVPNSEDVALWLGRDPTNPHLPAHRERFGEEFRPVRLRKFVYGYPAKANDFIFDKVLESKLPELITKHSAKKPTMIFCPTRASCSATSKSLSSLWQSTHPPARLWRGPGRVLPVRDPDLKQILPTGVAYHHAGLDLGDRRAVEEGFLTGQISILCTTSTLAVGINLPCYLVIVKNTVAWAGGAMQEYADLEMMQMLGRAGRPQFETSACAVIMTRHERVDHYVKMVAGQQCLESCLHLNLIDHLNAEVGLGTVYDVASARKWLAGTFLFVRLRLNPRHYRLNESVDTIDEHEMLEQICEKDIKLLQSSGLVTSGARIKCTEFGDAMARYYIKFETMQIFMSLPPRAKLSEILSAISQAAEFKDGIRFKSGEKSLYKEINKDVGIKFPIKVEIAVPAHKVSLLVQAELGGVDYPSNEQLQKHKHAFSSDRSLTFQHVHRLVRCIIDCQLHLEDAVAVRHGLELARSFGAKVWDNSPLQLKQLDQIGNVAVRKLASAGVNSIETLETTEAHRIEFVLGKNPPYGMKLLARVAEIPKLRITVKMTGKEARPGKPVSIKIKAEVGFLNEKTPLFFRRKPVYVCFLAETSDGKMIDFRRTSAKNLQKDWEILLSSHQTSPSQFITCSAMCDEVAGTMRQATLRPELPSSLFPAPAQESRQCSRYRQISSESSGSKCERKDSGDDFDDGGLQDNDLLDAEATADYMDLDDFPDVTKAPNEQLNNKQKQPVPKPQMVPDESWQPIQLENGKYACKHLCKDKTKCTHHCCKAGLEKPPKRPMRRVNSNRSNESDTALAKQGTQSVREKSREKSSHGRTPFEKAHPAFQGKRRCNTKPGAHERKSLKRLHESTGTAAPNSSFSHTKTVKPSYDDGQSRLSFLDKNNCKGKDSDDFDADWDSSIGIDDLQNLGDSGKTDLSIASGRFDAEVKDYGKAAPSVDEDFGLSDDKIFDFNPSNLDEASTSGDQALQDNNDSFHRGVKSTLSPTSSSLPTLTQKPRRRLNLDLSDDDELDGVTVTGSLSRKGATPRPDLRPMDSEMFVSESSPMKTLPQWEYSPSRTNSSSPFKRILDSVALPGKRPPSAIAELSRDGSTPKRQRLDPESPGEVNSKAVPLKEVTNLQSWEEVKQKQRAERARKATELADAELERKKTEKQKEKEELDRQTWGLLGPEFEEQFKDFVEFI
ncbi:MAG: hypothetical protein Q9160_006353 [Pyrenula sp. 1 TL-2023]